jgi:hypothetical protein
MEEDHQKPKDTFTEAIPMGHQEDHSVEDQEEVHQEEVHQEEVHWEEAHQEGDHQCPFPQPQSYWEEGTTN